MLTATVSLILTLSASPQATPAQPPPQASAQPSPLVEELWDAARAGDVTRVKKALDAGADVNAGNRYKATALTFAADKGHVEVITLLLDRGADPNIQDTFYRMRPLNMAVMNDHFQAAAVLLERGSQGAGQVLGQAATAGNLTVVQAALKAKDLTRVELITALAAAKRGKSAEVTAAIEKRLAEMPADSAVTVERG